MRISKQLCFILTLFFLLSGCKSSSVIYEIEPVTVRQFKISKTSLKSNSAFISIAYSDLMGAIIPRKLLSQLERSHNTFGDKKLFEDMILRLFLSENRNGKSKNYISAKIILKSDDPYEHVHELPYLIYISFIEKENSIDFMEGYNFWKWIQENAVNAPIASTNPEDGFFTEQNPEWYVEKGKTWKENFPMEVERCKVYISKLIGKYNRKDLNQAYIFARDRIIQNFDGTKGELVLPNLKFNTDDKSMREDISGFINLCFENFLNREPDEYELWKMQQMIYSDHDLSPRLFYYALMKSEEYRYF